MDFPSLVATAFAQSAEVQEVAQTAGFGGADITTIIGRIISVVLGVLGIIFLVLIIYSGLTWMTAGGDEDKVKRAKKILVNATIGLVLILAAYGIASFVLNTLTDATGGRGGTDNSAPGIESLSGSLGSGPIQDHYPERYATDVPRNTRIMVTFKEPVSESSFAGSDGLLNTDNVRIYSLEEGEDAFLTEVDVSFTEDGETVSFDPASYLGSPTADTWYTVSLGGNIENRDGDDMFTGSYAGGYEWKFEVGTELDLDPPSVVSVVPVDGGTYDRNIAVEITFDEAVDATSASGDTANGFTNIQTLDSSSTAVAGNYDISNGYRTVTFITTDSCGTNSCGETMYCLPANQSLTVTARAATTTIDPPQADSYPYDGVVDAAANALDGNDDGSAGDDYSWGFRTTGDINLEGPRLLSINPDILAADVPLDQSITLLFDSLMLTSSLTNENVAMANQEAGSGASHEMWYRLSSDSLTVDGAVVTSDAQTPVQTQVTIDHGVFVESSETETYLYGVEATEGVRNQYQNCFVPAEGPDAAGNDCAVSPSSPSCCNGNPQSAACNYFSS